MMSFTFRAKMLLLVFSAMLWACHAPKTAETNDSSKHVQGVETPLRGKTGDLVAIVFTSVDCPIANAMAPQLTRIYERAEELDVRCYLVYPRAGTTDEMMAEHAARYNLNGIRISDTDQVLVETLDARITPEAYVLEFTGPDEWRIRYRGRVNDLYPSIGNRRDQASTHDLLNAILALQANESVKTQRTQAIGCTIQRRN